MWSILLGFIWGFSIAVFNNIITQRFFLREESSMNQFIYLLRFILIFVAMVTAGRFGNLALLGTAAGLLSLFPIILWRAWRGK